MREARDNQRRSRKQERKLAKRMGGKVQPASGSTWGSKGDVLTGVALYEAKTTKAKQYTLKLETMQKIEREGLVAGKMPVLQITFEQHPKKEYAVITLDDLEYLLLGKSLAGSQ